MIIPGAIKNRDEQNFLFDLAMAQRSEKAVAIWIDNQNAFKKVMIANEKGYDILCQKENGVLKKIEVKRDFWVDRYEDGVNSRKATNNICVEIWSNFKCGNPGWIHYSDSDYIYYVGNENIYILDTRKLKFLTNSLVNYGEANKTEPTLKAHVNTNVAKIQYTAHYNGNFKVRSVLIKKDWLIKNQCIVRVIGTDISKFNQIANKFQI